MAVRVVTLKTFGLRSITMPRRASTAALSGWSCQRRAWPGNGGFHVQKPLDLSGLAGVTARRRQSTLDPLKGQKIETDKRPLRHVARFTLIGLYTGTRAGAIATASPYRAEGKSFVDLETGIFNRRAVGKRATTKRQTPVPLPNRLLAHLRRWARLGIAKSHFVEWNGKPVASVKTGFASGVRIAGLDVATGNVTPHTLRHTAATWLMQRGAPMWEAAGFLGMSEKTLRDTYGHHHPAHLRGAADAIASRPAAEKGSVGCFVG